MKSNSVRVVNTGKSAHAETNIGSWKDMHQNKFFKKGGIASPMKKPGIKKLKYMVKKISFQ